MPLAAHVSARWASVARGAVRSLTRKPMPQLRIRIHVETMAVVCTPACANATMDGPAQPAKFKSQSPSLVCPVSHSDWAWPVARWRSEPWWHISRLRQVWQRNWVRLAAERSRVLRSAAARVHLDDAHRPWLIAPTGVRIARLSTISFWLLVYPDSVESCACV